MAPGLPGQFLPNPCLRTLGSALAAGPILSADEALPSTLSSDRHAVSSHNGLNGTEMIVANCWRLAGFG
jgi:hypothetical protein